jgi:glutathione peroxidase-family protein
VGKDGKPIDRFGSMTSPSSKKLIKAIEEALEG